MSNLTKTILISIVISVIASIIVSIITSYISFDSLTKPKPKPIQYGKCDKNKYIEYDIAGKPYCTENLRDENGNLIKIQS